MAHRNLLTFFLSLFLTVVIFNSANCQSTRTDTLRIRYIVWDVYKDTCYPVLIQKEGYVIKFHSNDPIYLRRPDEREDICYLDIDKKKENGIVLKYTIRY